MHIPQSGTIRFTDLNKIRAEKSTSSFSATNPNTSFSSLRSWFSDNTTDGTTQGAIPATDASIERFRGRAVRLISCQAIPESDSRYDNSGNAQLKITFEPTKFSTTERVNNNPHFTSGSEISVTGGGTNQTITVTSTTSTVDITNLGGTGKWSSSVNHLVTISTADSTSQFDVDQQFYYHPGLNGTTTATSNYTSWVSLDAGGEKASASGTGVNNVAYNVESVNVGTIGNSITLTGVTVSYIDEDVIGFTTPNTVSVSAHGFQDNMEIVISDTTGVTGANGQTYTLNNNWYADVIDSDTFSLYEDSNLTTAADLSGTWGNDGTAIPANPAAGLEEIGGLIADWNSSNQNNQATVITGSTATIASGSTVQFAGGEESQATVFRFNWTGSTTSTRSSFSEKIFIWNTPHAAGGTAGGTTLQQIYTA